MYEFSTCTNLFAFRMTMCKVVWCLLAILCSAQGFVGRTGPSIVIIGAGTSGISAATRLLENNFTDIKIVEAESRIGGRVHSVKFGSSMIDLGGEYPVCGKYSVVYQRVKDYDVFGPFVIPSAFYMANSKVDEDISKEVLNILKTLIKRSSVEGDRKSSIGDYISSHFNDSVVSHFKDNPEKVKIALKSIDILEDHATAVEGAFSWHNAASLQDFAECEGDQSLTWRGAGFKLFLDVIMKKYPDPKQQLPIDDKIFLDKEVVQISWDRKSVTNKTVVRTLDNQTYECDHVIFTPSVGVLKQRHRELFQPALPEEKSEAIDLIGFDAVMKIVLYYSEIWWQDKEGFVLIWDLDDMDKLREEFTEGPSLNGRPWFTYMRVVDGFSYNPNVLVAWVTGPIIPLLEQMDESLVIRGMQHVFNKFFGHHAKVPLANKVIRSQWYTNPHFRGSYSYQTLKTASKRDGKSSEQVLAEPILNDQGRPILQFAGEATHDRYYGSVHGAAETGFREADRLIAIYK